MNCLKCSVENSFDANFCRVCAYPLTANFGTVSNARRVVPLAVYDEQTTVVSPARFETIKFDIADVSIQRFTKLIFAALFMAACVIFAIKSAGF